MNVVLEGYVHTHTHTHTQFVTTILEKDIHLERGEEEDTWVIPSNQCHRTFTR
jgi:hypothetical protein